MAVTKNFSVLYTALSGLVPGGAMPWPYTPPSDPDAVGDVDALAHADATIGKLLSPPYRVIESPTEIPVYARHVSGMAYVGFRVDGGAQWRIPAAAASPVIGNLLAFRLSVNPARFAAGLHKMVVEYMPVSGVPRYETWYFWTGVTWTVRYVDPSGLDITPDDLPDHPGAGLTAETALRDPATALASMLVDPNVSKTLPRHCKLVYAAGSIKWKHLSFPWNLIAQESDDSPLIFEGQGIDATFFKTVAAEQPSGVPYMLSLSRVKFQDMTFNDGPAPVITEESPATRTKWTWAHNCVSDGVDRFDPTTNANHDYYTSCTVTNQTNGCQNARMVLNTAILNTLTGGPWDTLCVVNTTIDGVDTTKATGSTLVLDPGSTTSATPSGYTPSSYDVSAANAPNQISATFGTTLVSGTVTAASGGKFTISWASNGVITAGATGTNWRLFNAAHADLWRTQGSATNIILYGFAEGDNNQHTQGLVFFSRGDTGQPLYEFTSVAIERVTVGSGSAGMVLGGVCRHFLIKDSALWGDVRTAGYGTGAEAGVPLFDIDETVVFEDTTATSGADGTGSPLDLDSLFPGATIRSA